MRKLNFSLYITSKYFKQYDNFISSIKDAIAAAVSLDGSTIHTKVFSSLSALISTVRSEMYSLYVEYEEFVEKANYHFDKAGYYKNRNEY